MGKKNKNKNKSNNNSISTITKGNLNLDSTEIDLELNNDDIDESVVVEENLEVEESEEPVVVSEDIEVPVELEKDEEVNAVEDKFESINLTSEEPSITEEEEEEEEEEVVVSPVMESIDLSPEPIIEESKEEETVDDDDLISSTTISLNLEEPELIEEIEEEEDKTASTISPTSTHNTSTTTLDESITTTSIGSSPSTAPPSIKLFSLPTSISLLPTTETEIETEPLETSTNNSSITNLELSNTNSSSLENLSTPPSPTNKSVKFQIPTTTTSIIPSSTNTTPPSSTLDLTSNGNQNGTTETPTLEISKPTPTPPRRGSTIRQLMVSMTRQRDLPPKSKDEEKRHLKELEQMLASSKASDLRRKSALDLQITQKANNLNIASQTWESYILPNWRIVLRKDNEESKSLRNLWWNGTMPSKIRGRIWSMCIGNSLALNKNLFGILLARAKELEKGGNYPKEVRDTLEKDVEGTLKELKLFQRDGAMFDDLVDLLLAYSVYDKEVPEYPKGISFPAAMILLNMSPPDAFLGLINLVNKSILKSFYSNIEEDMEAYYRIFDTLLADNMPFVYANFTQETVKPSLYLYPWLTTLFVQYLPLDLSIRLFDNFLLEGDSFLFRVALVLLQILEPRLFNPQLSELEAVFKGIDRGAVVIVRREKTRGTGGAGGEVQEEIEVGIEEVYTEMGVNEERLFGKLELLDWKEETWDRLVTRELPEND